MDITEAVTIARNCDGLFPLVAELYRRLDEVTASAPCKACGACCDFETFGHRLYLSTIELAYLLEKSQSPENITSDDSDNQCPWYVGKLCTARDGRAIGCRVFNCRVEPESENALYEQFHQQIMQLHEQFDIPYMYMYLPNAARKLLEL